MTGCGVVLLLLGMLFGGAMAGDYCYNLDHALTERTHHANPDYRALLNRYEIAGAGVGSVPGMALLVFAWREKRCTR